MKNNDMFSDTLPIKTAIFSTIAIAIGVVITVFAAQYLQKARKSSVIANYTNETNAFLGKHPQETRELFTTVFDTCKMEYEDSFKPASPFSSPRPRTYSDEISCKEAQNHLAKMNVSELKDPSSITYIRVRDLHYEIVDASGSYVAPQLVSSVGYRFSYDKNEDLMEYFLHNKTISMWENYINRTGGKEVIVPVTIDEKTKGYIFRGVVER